MTPVGKIVKLLLAVTVGALVASGLYGCKKEEPRAAVPPAAPPAGPAPQAARVPMQPSTPARLIELKVTESGFEPTPITLRAGQAVMLKVTRTTEATCATDLNIDEFNIHEPLPLNQTVTVRFLPTKPGELKYGCGMEKMVSGKFFVE